MDKEVLRQYMDACVLVQETEREIKRLRCHRKQLIQDSVKGSMQEFPYVSKNYHLEGLSYAEFQNPGKLERQELLLNARKLRAEEIKLQVEAWLNTIPQRMQRIIQYKVFEEMTWAQVAVRMGRKATADGVRVEFRRFMDTV